MAHRVVHRIVKDGGNFNNLLEAMTDLRNSIGAAPYSASKTGPNNSDGEVADVNRTTTFIAPNIIEFTDIWTDSASKDAHYTNRVKPAFNNANVAAGSAPGGWSRTVVSAEDI